jgi:transglutaminase-like putative cysteine protease
MGIISVEKLDHLYWLGRYMERVYTTLRKFFRVYDDMIEEQEGFYRIYCERLNILDIYNSSVYTRPTDNIQKYLRELSLPEDTMLRKSVYLMNSLYERFRYVPGSTDIHTTAGEAFDKNKGVCQDYAHIFITLCRQSGIPSRYVNGLMIGEGYTHAWVEVYTGDGWYGLDPTNNLHVDDYYIKLAHGRDYADCVLEKEYFGEMRIRPRKYMLMWRNCKMTETVVSMGLPVDEHLIIKKEQD